jgi:hypothetical protein
MVGTTGFEPATSSPPAKRATKLRQVPDTKENISSNWGLASQKFAAFSEHAKDQDGSGRRKWLHGHGVITALVDASEC